MPMVWKPGRGKLGPLAPLIGRWKAQSDSPMGPMSCVRDFQPFGQHYVRLEAEWTFGARSAGKPYRETCFFGPGEDGELAFWSFTNDGKKSVGRLSDGSDLHPKAVCFEAQMPAGLARQVFWPDAESGFHWNVGAKIRKGWSLLAQHHYLPA